MASKFLLHNLVTLLFDFIDYCYTSYIVISNHVPFQEDQFVDLIMGEISKLVDGSETYSPTLKLLQRDLGTQVYHK